MKKFLFALFFPLLFPLLSHAACSEEALAEKEVTLINFRVGILKAQEKDGAFADKVKARLNQKDYKDYRAEVMAGPGKETMCATVDELTVMADDMLAGGDGAGAQKPWKKHTPEGVYAQKLELDRICADRKNKACRSEKMTQIAMQFVPLEKAIEAMKITPGEMMDKAYELYGQMLDTLKEKNTP